MNIAIIGAGAMGGMLAAKISSAVNKVVLVDVSEPLVSHLNEHGLSVETKNEGTETYKLLAVSNPVELGIQDIVFFFVKAHHTAAAAQLSKPMIGEKTIVVSLQNGWGNADVLADVFAAEQIVVGVTYHSATVLGLGRVGHTGMGATFAGPYKDGADMTRSEQIGRLLHAGGIEVTVTPKVKTEIWKKLILNAATLPTSALTGLCAGIQGEPGPMLELVDNLALEASSVAQSLGYEIDSEERIQRIHTVLQNAGKGKSSMLQDAELKRKTEIEVVNGAVVRAAEKTGVAVPLNKAMMSLISGLERSWKQ